MVRENMVVYADDGLSSYSRGCGFLALMGDVED